MLGMFLHVFAVGQAITSHFFTWRHFLYLLGIVMFGLGAGIVAVYLQRTYLKCRKLYRASVMVSVSD
jgi:hypothetical protein